jgi:hypothetical protein
MSNPVGFPQVGAVGSLGKVPEVPSILSNVAGTFAWHVWHDRHPALLEQIRAAHPFSGRQLRAIDSLLEETIGGTMARLPDEASDKAGWDEWGSDYFGQSWLDAPFLWAESYFYRRLLDAVDYFAPGPWLGHDLFAFLKSAELSNPGLEGDLRAMGSADPSDTQTVTTALLLSSLWGNRADLGFHIGVGASAGHVGAAADLVVDDTCSAVAAFASGAGRRVCVVVDNAGRELLADLILSDHLLASGISERVELHLKPQPYYTSDATTADLVRCLRRLAATPGVAADIADRLRVAAAADRFAFSSHWFYCTPFTFHRLPSDLADEVASATLVVMKGDLNYRRLVGDCHWSESTPFGDAVSYFPAPVVALRTLKSDVVVGMDPATVAELDASGTDWRIDGRHGLVQARL